MMYYAHGTNNGGLNTLPIFSSEFNKFVVVKSCTFNWDHIEVRIAREHSRRSEVVNGEYSKRKRGGSRQVERMQKEREEEGE